MQADDGECKSVLVFYSRVVRKEMMEDRQFLRSIVLDDINDIDSEGYFYMFFSDYRFCILEYELEVEDREDFVEDLLFQSRYRFEYVREDEEILIKKYERQLFFFVSFLVEKYVLIDWKDKRWKKYVNIEYGMVFLVYIGGKGNLSNNVF